MVGKVILNGVAGVLTDPDTQLKYVEITATNKPTLSIQRLSGTLAIDNTTTTGLQSAPFKVQSSSGNTGSGLLAQYFNSKNNFTGTPALTRVDSQINFDWGLGSPDAKINSDNFSVRWTGYVQAPKTGLYTFYGNTNEGVKLSVDGKVLINDLTDNLFGSVERTSTTIQLNAGQSYALQMDYYESTGFAASTLSWSAVDGNKTTIVSKEIIGADKFSTFDQVSLGLGDFTLSKGSTLDLGGGIKATVKDVSKEIGTTGTTLIDTTGTTVTVTLPDSVNLNAIATGGKASLNAENVTVKLLAGDGYTLSGNSQATLEIADNDAPGLRIIQTGDRPIVQEGATTDFQISLLSEPTVPVTVYLNPDSQLTVTNLNPPLLDAKLSNLSFDKTTGSLQLRLFRQPTADVTIAVTPKSAIDPNQLTFTSTNWDQYQTVDLASLTNKLKVDDPIVPNFFYTTVKDSLGTSYSLRFQQVAENKINYLPPLGTKGFYGLTFDASNWYIPQTVEISAIDNNKIDEVLRDGSIKYGIVTGDPSYASLTIADQSIGIIDRLIDTKEVKAGIGGSLDTFKDSINDFELPIIGKLGNDPTMSDVVDTVSAAVQAALDSVPVPTAKALELAIETKLTEFAKKITVGGVELFATPEVTVEMDENGISFTINIGQKFTKDWKLPSDFGVSGGLFSAKAAGGIEVALEYDMTLAFGVNKDFGFYINTGDSGVRFAVGGGLTSDFSAEANVGFIQVKATNAPDKPTEISAEAILQFADPDNRSTFKFFDVNSDGKFNGNPIIYSSPVDTTPNDDKPDVDATGNLITKDVSIQEPFTEIDWKGTDKYALPSLTATTGTTVAPAYSNIDWNGNKVFDKPETITGKGVYRTIPISAATATTPAVTEVIYYLDANRNGKLDKSPAGVAGDPNQLRGELWTISDAWVDKTNTAVTKVKEFEIKTQAQKVNGKGVFVPYFDQNGDGKYSAEEALTPAQETKYGVGTIKGDSTVIGEGSFVRGRGIAYRDTNKNGQLDLEPFVDTNNNGRWDTGEATVSNNSIGNTIKPNREVFVMSGYKPIEVDDKGLTTFLDLNGDRKQTSVVSNSGSSEPNILTYSLQKDEYQFLNLTGDVTFEPTFIKDANGEDTEAIDPANYFTGDMKILKNGEDGFSYLDLNGDEAFSTGGEPLRDANDNKKQDNGESFIDLNGNGTWESTGVADAIINFGAPTLTFFDIDNDGKQTWLLDANDNGIKDTGEIATTGLISEKEVKSADGKEVLSTFDYLDTSLDGDFTSGTEFKVVQTTFGKILDKNDDGIFNAGDVTIISQEGMIRKVYESALNNFDSTTFEYLDINNDGKYSLGLGAVPSDVLIKSDANGTYVTINNTRFNGKRIDFVDVNVDSQYSSDDLRIVKATPTSKSSYYDANADGKKDSDESLIIDAVTYLDVNGDFSFNSADTSTSLGNALVDAFKDFKKAATDSNSLEATAPDPIEPMVLQDGEGGRYLDLNFNQTRDVGEPFSADAEEPMAIAPENILTFDIVSDTVLTVTTRYVDNDGSGTFTDGDQNLDEILSLTSTQKVKLADLFRVGANDLSVTFLDVDGNRSLGVKDYPVLINGEGKQFVDIKRDGELNTIDERDLNSNDRISIPERGFESEPFAEANNDFSALTDLVYQPARTIDTVGTTTTTTTTVPGVYYYDLNRNGQYDKLSDVLKADASGELVEYFDDGESLTAPEILKALVSKQAGSLFTFEAGASATLGLHLSAGSSNAQWPSLSGDLFLEIPSPRIVYDQEGGLRKEATTTSLELKDIKLDLGSAITNIIKPIVSKINTYIEPIKPIVKFLTDDIKIPTQLGVDSLLESDGKPGTNLLEIAEKLLSLATGDSTTPTTAAGSTPTTTPATTPDPAKALSTTEKALKSLQTALKFTKVIVNLIEAVDTLNDLTKDSASLELALGSWQKEFAASNTATPDPETSVATQAVTTPPKPATTTGTVATTSTAINAPANTPSSFKKALNAIQAIEGLKFPFLTDFSVPIRLLLGEKGVDLITFEPPKLALDASFSVGTYIYPAPPIKVGINGSIGVSTDLLFGFDTSGAQDWKESGFELSEIYKVLDGFYLGDKHDGVDTPEVTVTGEVAPYAALDAVIASFTIEGGISATVGLDLVDEGEDNGTSDGKLRISEIIAKIKRASTADGNGIGNFLSYMFKLSGVVDAFLRASLDISLLGTVWSEELARVTLFEFSLGGGQPASSGGLIGHAGNSNIHDGTVFWDANFNGILDAEEPSTTTNLDASYALDVPIDRWDANGNFKLDATDGRVVVQGGTDQLSGQPLQGQLTALPNSLVVTPLTTLKADLVRGLVLQGSAESVATVVVETQLKKVLGISDAVNLDNFNPIAALLELKDPNGAQVYQTHVQIQTLLLNAKEFLSSATGKTGGDVTNAAIAAIAKGIGSADPNKVIDLADAVQLKALFTATLQAAAQALANNTLDATKLGQQVNSTLDVAAKGNTLNQDLASSLKLAIAQGNDLNSTLEGFSSNKIIAQTFLPMETKAVVEGTQGFYLKDPIAAPLFVQESQAFTFNLSDRFVNVSGDPITYTLTEALPTGLTFNSTTGILQGTLSAATSANTAPLLIGFSAANTKANQLSGSFSLNLNYIPTAISLTNSSVIEKLAIGTVVGELTTTDANTTDTFTYKLVTGVGSDDNAAFAIEGNKLKTAKTFDAAQQNQYKVRVLTQDASGSIFEKPLTIQIQSTNNPPTATDDNVTTNVDTSVNIDVLKNDQDIDKDPLTLSVLTLPTHGTAKVNDNNTPDQKDDDFISYLPVAAYTLTVR